jgi:hypothetical protein
VPGDWLQRKILPDDTFLVLFFLPFCSDSASIKLPDFHLL